MLPFRGEKMVADWQCSSCDTRSITIIITIIIITIIIIIITTINITI